MTNSKRIMPLKSPSMTTCSLTTNSTCQKGTTARRKSLTWSNSVRYKSPIASVTWPIKREKKCKPLIKFGMVTLCWLRNGKQNQIDETEPSEPKKRRAGNDYKAHHAPKSPANQLALVSKQADRKNCLQEWRAWGLHRAAATAIGNP